MSTTTWWMPVFKKCTLLFLIRYAVFPGMLYAGNVTVAPHCGLLGQHHGSNFSICSTGRVLFSRGRRPGCAEWRLFFQFFLSLHGYG